MLFVGLLAAVLLAVWVRWMEPRMLYYPTAELVGTPAGPGWRFEEVRLLSADGTQLHAWWIPADVDSGGAPPAITVLLLHGNAGNRSHRLEKLAILRGLGADVLILDYRGYGGSEGRPDEEGTYRDARAAHAYLVQERGCNPRRVVIHGESLGSAVAADLAASVEVGGLVLEEAFTSVTEVAQGMLPFLPMRWLIRNRYDALGRVARVHAPVLLLHSRDDEYFPMRHAEQLAAVAREPTLVELRGGHNDAFLVSAAAWRQALERFFATVAERAAMAD